MLNRERSAVSSLYPISPELSQSFAAIQQYFGKEQFETSVRRRTYLAGRYDRPKLGDNKYAL
jgi:hypothetical protein